MTSAEPLHETDGLLERIPMKTFTSEDLGRHCGSDGQDTLVAVDGMVYDLSASKKWIKGLHMKRHKAGTDLSSDLPAAPHGREVLEGFEQVGLFEVCAEETFTGIRASAERLVELFPWFRRHPHPAAVHLPIGLMLAAPILECVAILTGSPRTEWAAFCCLILALLFLPAVLASGYFTWWINYSCTESKIIKAKRRSAWVLTAFAAIAVALRGFVVQGLPVNDSWGLAYLAAMAAMTVAVSYVGYLGGKLTFPYH